MNYRLVIGTAHFDIGNKTEGNPFQLYTYANLGIQNLESWKNLLRVHLYSDRIFLVERVRNHVKFYENTTKPDQVYSPSDLLSIVQRGYQIYRVGDNLQLFKPSSGKVIDDSESTAPSRLAYAYTYDEIIGFIEKGYVLVPHE